MNPFARSLVSTLTCAMAVLIAVPAQAADCGIFVSRFETGTTCAWTAAPGSADACSPPGVTIEEVQSGARAGEAVALSNVVVTALSADGKNLWVADGAVASACHGVFVFRGSDVLSGEIVPGAVVDVTGTAVEFDSNVSGDTLTEISGATVVFESSGAAPTPLLAPFSEVGAIGAGEAYESVLVRTPFVQVTSFAAGDVLTLTSASMSSVLMDDVIYDYASASYPINSTCFNSVTGIMGVNLVDDQRRLYPRSVADLNLVSCD